MRKLRRRFHLPSLLAGVIIATLLGGALLWAGMFWLSSTAPSVYLDSEELAQIIGNRIMTQIHRELPLIIEGAKSEIPAIVEREMATQLTSDRMEIAGFVFTVPEELMAQIKHSMQANVENATAKILDGIDAKLVGERFGEDVYRLVRETLRREVDGKTFTLLLLGKMPVKVKVHVQ